MAKQHWFRLHLILWLLATAVWLRPSPMPATQAAPAYSLHKADSPNAILSPVWGPNIQQWSILIVLYARQYGLDPDFVAAVIKEESNGDHSAVSRAGAVGLMGVMPTGPGLEWRPTTEALKDPATNISWGSAILGEIIKQSGGDVYSALAAYTGGWPQVEAKVPRQYAANVLNNYGRAIVVRSGLSPEIANRWTLAVELRRGNVPSESLLVLGSQPLSGLQVYGEHVVYDFVDPSGRTYFVKGYAVPVALVVPPWNTDFFGSGDSLESQLQGRLTGIVDKSEGHNPAVLIACLPSLSRLRGHASTRWYAPSFCPDGHR